MGKRGPRPGAWTEAKRAEASLRKLGKVRPTDEEIVARIRSTGNAAEVARWAGLTPQRVSQIWKAHGGEPRAYGSWEPWHDDRLMQLVTEGLNVASIAGRMFGFTEAAIQARISVLRKSGRLPKGRATGR